MAFAKKMNKKKITAFCILSIIALGIIVLISPIVKEYRASQILGELKSTPLKSSFYVADNGIYGVRHSFSIGNYGITDLGNVRLAFEGLDDIGSSSKGSITLATDSTHFGGGGGTGGGKQSFRHESIPHGTRCNFTGVPFRVVSGKLKIADEEFDVTGERLLIIIDDNQRISDVIKL